MSIERTNISKNLILLFFLCKEMKLCFETVQKVFLKSEKKFWAYFYAFMPGLRINYNKFDKYNSLAENIFKNFNCLDKLDLLETEKELVEMFLNRIKDKFTNGEDIYSYQDILEYINNTNKPYKVVYTDGSLDVLKNSIEFCNNMNYITSIIINNRELTKTSNYSFYLDKKGSI